MTNTIPYLDILTKWESVLSDAPSGLLVFALCIAAGYVWKVIKVLPNRFIPLVVMTTGATLNVLLRLDSPDLVRVGVVGFIIGFLAWLFHRLLLKRLEDKFGVKIDETDETKS